jgi:hypothetical protein
MNKTNNINILILEQDLPSTRKVLFEFALNWSKKDHTVIYITEKRIDQFPATALGATSFNVAYKNVLFFYYDTYAALLTCLMEIHTWATIPKLIIVESLHNYVDAKKGADLWLKEMALLIATLHNAVDSCSEKFDEPCFSVASITNDHVPTGGGLNVLADLYYYKIRPLVCTDIVLNKWNK